MFVLRLTLLNQEIAFVQDLATSFICGITELRAQLSEIQKAINTLAKTLSMGKIDIVVLNDIMSEDVAFCKNIQKAGYDIMLKATLRVGHEKKIVL